MGKVSDYIKQLEKVTVRDQEREILAIIRINQDKLIDLNHAQLLDKGIDGSGHLLEHYHSPAYAEVKLHLNPKGVTDLKLTGDFHEGWFVKANKFPVIMDSKDNKRNELVEKYGKEIFELTDKSKDVFKEFVKHQVEDLYHNEYLRVRSS